MRSGVIATALLAALMAACARSESADSARPTETGAADRESPHLIEGTLDTRIGPDGNTTIFGAPGGLVVVDAGRHMTHSQKILDYAAERGLPIVAIVNTHWHLDHSTGNQDLKAPNPAARLHTTRAIEGALDGFLARSSARTEERLRQPDLPDAERKRLERGFNTIRGRVTLLPDVPVEGTMSLPVSGRDLELHTTQRAVTESDVWIWDPATRTVIAGDLATLPVPLFDTGCPHGWLAALDAIAAKAFEQLIPGHGDPMDPDEFSTYRRAFANFVSCAESRTGAECAEAWLVDAGPLMDRQTDRDLTDRAYARAAAQYYVDEVIRSEERRAEFCDA